MKKNLFLIALLFITSVAIAQVPNTINYQAVARNNAGQALAAQTIKVRLSIIKGASILYSETRSVTTNALGLFNIQIGSAGALSTTGSFTNFSWTNNSPDNKTLKVELDINNTNVFTDMGTQALATVPYAFSAAEAINALSIGGNYVSTNTPQLNDILKWNGTAWAPANAPTAPAIYTVAGTIPVIAFGGGGAPWEMAGPNSNNGGYATVTVTDGQTITANFNGVLGHSNINPQPLSFSVCYEQVVSGVPTGSIHSFQSGNYTDGTVAATGNKTLVSATGAVKVVTGTTIPTAHQIPPGTYRICLGIKNKSTTSNFSANDYVNGTVIVF